MSIKHFLFGLVMGGGAMLIGAPLWGAYLAQILGTMFSMELDNQ